MKARRKRFTVYTPDPRAILAVNKEEAAAYFRNRGFSVDRVDAGDYRAIPKRPSGAKVHWENLEKAKEFFALKLPVCVKLSTRSQFRMGGYLAVPSHSLLTRRGSAITGTKLVLASHASWTHEITLAAGLSAADMGATLWHELAHAMQFERDVSPTGTVHDALRTWRSMSRDGVAYNQKPYEIEADSYMLHNDELPLAR